MTIYRCLVHGTMPTDLQQRLAEGLTFLTVSRFGASPDPVEVSFTEIEEGRWFTAGEPSSTTMVLGSVPAGTSQEVREAHLDQVARFVAETTGDDLDQIMVVAADANP